MSNAIWLRALERTAPVARQPARILPVVIDEIAARSADALALASDREAGEKRETHETLSYRQLVRRSNHYARWALELGLAPGETVALLMPNRPEYIAIWLGITRVGGIVALLNTNLIGPSLAHCIAVVRPRHLIVDDSLAAHVAPGMTDARIWRAREIEGETAESIPIRATIADPALYIYTSGTTGLPKAARVSHRRILQWSFWFAGLLDTGPVDRMYDCLPLYHSTGGVVAVGATLVGGGAVIIREQFSAREFWTDIVRWECTLFQYIGELCRYLMVTEPERHRVRIACGNGLGADIFEAFQRRFAIPRILEFYAATEGTFSLYNVEGKPGAIGRIPPYLAQRDPVRLVRYDVECGEPVRDAHGRCVPCAVDEPGEAIGKLERFEGYTDCAANEQKVLRDVFAPGDAWYRTGDLMRRDREGFFYFVDRTGDTFRWKGENVATTEVATALLAFPGVHEASVYGVAVPGADGRAGMAAIVADEGLDLAALYAHLAARLPRYARPVYLRLARSLVITGTFKHTKAELARQGCDPSACADPIYYADLARDTFVALAR